MNEQSELQGRELEVHVGSNRDDDRGCFLTGCGCLMVCAGIALVILALGRVGLIG